MTNMKNILPISALILLAACVSESQMAWRPLVDTASDTHVGMLEEDYAQCQRLAVHTPASIGGLNQDSPEADQQFKKTYIDCMKERGHPIITVNLAETPTPGNFAPPGMRGYGGR